jgi:23S rRNA (cytosine1962-C5)-methyltransferase
VSGAEAVVVDARGARRLDGGHPWVYRGDIVRGPDTPGAFPIEDDRGTPLGTGFFSPRSKITLRRISPERVEVDEGFFRERLDRAVEHRARWGLTPDGPTTAYRLLHAEGDGVPGIVVDRYADVMVVQVTNAGAERYAPALTAALLDRFRPRGILARNDTGARRLEGLPRQVDVLAGEVPREVEVRENGSRFVVDLFEGQKTGAYLDQKDSHALVARHARGRMLDLFTYQGWFAVQAAAGADEVTAVDSSEPAVERVRRNAALNGVGNVRTEAADVFAFLDGAEPGYETIVLDPPPFARRKGDVRSALSGYTRLHARCLDLLAPNGLLFTFSCSHHVTPEEFAGSVRRAAGGTGRRVRIAAVIGQPADHPQVPTVPETGYLTGLLLEAMG